MKIVIVASTNPVKAEAVLRGFRQMFPEETFGVETLSVASGVSEQPMTDQESFQGAINRVENAKIALPENDFWVGIEGGCDFMGEDLVAFAWIVILGKNRQGSARTALFRLPPAVKALLQDGFELGDADDQVFGRTNSKQKTGAVGLLTGNVVTRTTLYEQAVILALIPFKNPHLYGIC